jgi:hypothetical protein
MIKICKICSQGKIDTTQNDVINVTIIHKDQEDSSLNTITEISKHVVT